MALDITAVIKNINDTIPLFWKFITAFTYFLGTWFALRSMLLLKKYGEARAGGGGQADIKKPLVNFLVAVVFLYFPAFMQVSLYTLYGSTTIVPYEYTSSTGEDFSKFLSIGGNIIQFIGFIAFVRGWILMVRIAEQGAQQGAFSKAFMHILGGILAINIFGTWTIIRSIIGV